MLPAPFPTSDLRVAFLLDFTEPSHSQVKRMMAAVSNRVVALERIRFGNLSLPEDLKPGEWTWVKSVKEITG